MKYNMAWEVSFLLKALRYALYVQLLLGLGRMFGMVPNEAIWGIHTGVGIIVAILGLLALRPLPELDGDIVRAIARFAPVITLLTGLAMMFNVVTRFAMIHMLIGIVTIGLVEMSAGRQRRALQGAAAG